MIRDEIEKKINKKNNNNEIGYEIKMIRYSHTLAHHFFFINILYFWKTKLLINQFDNNKKKIQNTKTKKLLKRKVYVFFRG
jgi:hypothetical protein